MAIEKLEILSVDLLDRERARVEEFRALSKQLGIQLGWHYLLDLPWAAAELAHLAPGARVLDAGAGLGLMQWWLSDHQVDVLSVDRAPRAHLSRLLRLLYPIRGLRPQDLLGPPRLKPSGLLRSARALFRSFVAAPTAPQTRLSKGTVTIFNQDLGRMPDVPDASMDAVVSISSLEHNSPEGLKECLAELLRVLKPGGRLVATVGAAKSADWFHEPSKGWCYTDASLRRIFDLPCAAPSNYDHYDELMAKLRDCADLKNALADFYFQGGNNGMPWGKWDPQYQSAGVVKIKPS